MYEHDRRVHFIHCTKSYYPPGNHLLGTCKNVPFPGQHHPITTVADDLALIIARALIVKHLCLFFNQATATGKDNSNVSTQPLK